jgi:murein DD-endopeptidase MepM/ murein hydrolase activator NlpD
MKGLKMAEDKLGSGRSFKPLFMILGIIILAFAGLAIFRVGSSPIVKIQPKMLVIGKKTPVTVEIAEPRRGLTHVRIELVQEGKSVMLAEKSYPPSSQLPFIGSKIDKDAIAVEAGRQSFPALIGGTATIRVTVDRAGTWLRHPTPKIEELTLPVRLTPPSLQITSIQTYVSQGGCEAVTYRVGESAVRDGVRADSWWFPGYLLPGGGPRDRFAIFAVPYNMSEPNVRLVVEDAAGNSAEMGFIDKFFPKPMRSDTIEVSDSFLNKVVPPILSQTPEIREQGTLLDSYLLINRELRKKNGDTIKSLFPKSASSFLWSKPFLMMPNSKVTAHFAERRTYMYQGRQVDQQDHLGFDLAQTKQAPIPAANAGIVVLAKFFGIYGNAVVIDHGLGMMTIYGHLSSITVTEGQKVGRGDIIGKTGETGLAGGDHLHFCTLLQGLPVNPEEWIDEHWIKDRIAKKLGPGFAFVP